MRVDSGIERDRDERVYLRDVSWPEYERVLAIRGDDPSPRMSYDRGLLELRTHSRGHEVTRHTIGRLVETYSTVCGVFLNGFGSWTLVDEESSCGLDPDECYGVRPLDDDRPDLALDVHWTPGEIRRLDVYARLGVPEVWVYDSGELAIHTLMDCSYTRVGRSAQLPDLEIDLLRRHIDPQQQYHAVRAYATALGAG